MARCPCFVLLPTLAIAPRSRSSADEPGAAAALVMLLVAYGSYKDRGRYRTITFYEHDGVSQGKVIETIPPTNLRSNSHPGLNHDGGFMEFVPGRRSSLGERSACLHDCVTSRLLLTPDLNSKREEIEPCVIVLPER